MQLFTMCLKFLVLLHQRILNGDFNALQVNDGCETQDYVLSSIDYIHSIHSTALNTFQEWISRMLRILDEILESLLVRT